MTESIPSAEDLPVGDGHDNGPDRDGRTAAADDDAAPAAHSPDLRGGTITLAATPIGNTTDASQRLRCALEQADLIAAEDTRRLRALTQRLGVEPHGRVIAFHEHNERERAAELLEAARAGLRVLVVSDAGMPSVSDPGYRLVRAAVRAQVPVTVAPGPSAVLTALALSGLASDRFCFEGFLPRKPGERRRALESLAAMAEVLGGERPAALCRELTKTHEQVLRAPLVELVRATADGVLGEVVLVVAGAEPVAASPQDAARRALALAESGMRLKAAAAQAAGEAGLRPNEVYRAALELRDATA